MGSKVPTAVISILTANVVGVERKQSLVGSHTRGSRVELHHEVIVHVTHAVPLETKLVDEVQEDLLDLLLGEWDLSVRSPCGIGLAGSLTHGKSIGSVDGSSSSRRSVSVGDLRGWRSVSSATHLALAVAVVPFVTTAVVITITTTGIRPHGKVTESLRVLLGVMGTASSTALVVVSSSLVIVLVVIVVILVVLLVVVIVAILRIVLITTVIITWSNAISINDPTNSNMGRVT